MVSYVRLSGLAVPTTPEAIALADQLIAIHRKTVPGELVAIAAHGDGRLTGHSVSGTVADLIDEARQVPVVAPRKKKR